jgi:ankyrin repeat protein
MRNGVQVQSLLRDNGATLAGEGLTYVVKMCEYAAEGNVDKIRLLATNGVDVSLGDYDDRTPLHLAACNGNTAVLEYLLKQETVLVNAVDRFGGTPYEDALRHGRKGAGVQAVRICI